MKRIKLFEEFSEWDRDDFLLDLFTMTSTEVENLFWKELKSKTPHIEKIGVMLESGLVDVNTKHKWGRNPLHLASRWNRVEIAKILIEAGANLEAKEDNGDTPLHWASDSGSIGTVELLIEKGANVDAKSDSWGFTPLHYASANDRVEVAKLLIDAGANVDAKSNKGRTPLHFANSCSSDDIINLLIEAGADEDIVDIDDLLWFEFYGDDWDANLDDDWYDGEGE